MAWILASPLRYSDWAEKNHLHKIGVPAVGPFAPLEQEGPAHDVKLKCDGYHREEGVNKLIILILLPEMTPPKK